MKRTVSPIMEYIGVNISERESGTERTKKRKKRESVICVTTRGRNCYCSTSSRRYTDFCRATITRGIFIQALTWPVLSRRQNTQHFTIYQSELALQNTGNWLPSRRRAHLERIFLNSKYAKKRDILSTKRECGMTLKKREFTPESGTVDTYVE